MKRIFFSLSILLCYVFLWGCGSSSAKGGVDVDLSQLSSTVAYAQLYDILSKPEDYVDKTIKIRGVYRKPFDESTNKYYDYVVLEDTAACCIIGIEFISSDENIEFPEENHEIEITGVLKSTQKEFTYYYLDEAHMIIR